MKLQDLKPDAGLYGKLVTGLCELSKFQDAANFLDEMVLGGISPNHVTLNLHVKINNLVIQGLCSENDLNRAFQVYLSTRTRGISVSAKSFSSLVACFCKKGDVHKAFQLLARWCLMGVFQMRTHGMLLISAPHVIPPFGDLGITQQGEKNSFLVDLLLVTIFLRLTVTDGLFTAQGGFAKKVNRLHLDSL
ncbi:hypothetical protein IFM89_026858 [Coptis chinensis]|uniref:Pentatricopeptide repeat-containing protein n=1 Tax=Coptis chinensis TaxID=261450 RepID=A0A835LKL0_9MAGN|nr:hypothetical protein IFM89_026858 [Coptis chinensis]